MRLIQHLLGAIALCTLAVTASATPANPQNNVEFVTLQTPQPTDAANKIEVIEFFAYYCPHCNVWEPTLSEWVKKQGSNIVFKRIHISYDARVEPQQRLFFTLEAMGLVEQYQAKAFHAMHVDRLPLSRDEQVFEWAEKAGIDRTKFINTYRSFGVQAKMRKVENQMANYGVDQWPMIIVDGRFQTSPTRANTGLPPNQPEVAQQAAALQVMDVLIARAKAEKK